MALSFNDKGQRLVAPIGTLFLNRMPLTYTLGLVHKFIRYKDSDAQANY